MNDQTKLGPVLSTITIPYRPELVELLKEDGSVRELGDKEHPYAFRFRLSAEGFKESGIDPTEGVRRLTIEFDATVSGEPMMTLVFSRKRDLAEWEEKKD